MKNPLLTCFMLLLCVCSFAQTKHGSFKIAGGASYSRSDDKREYRNGGNETSSTSLRFQPSIAYFVIDKLAIGASVSLSRTAMKFDEQSVYADERSISTSSSIGPPYSITFRWVNPFTLSPRHG
jgi:outer membrane protein